MSEAQPLDNNSLPNKPWWKKWWGITLIVFGVLILVSSLTNTEPNEETATKPPTMETAPPVENEQDEDPSDTDETPTEEAEQEEPSLSIGQRNAISSAESYLRFTAFSRTGLIGQLEFEGYATEDATFAVDYLDIDWNEQAAKSAEAYLSFSSFSRQGLIDQLVFEGFTRSEAEYGVEQVGY
jgi:hypothetical protein